MGSGMGWWEPGQGDGEREDTPDRDRYGVMGTRTS